VRVGCCALCLSIAYDESWIRAFLQRMSYSPKPLAMASMSFPFPLPDEVTRRCDSFAPVRQIQGREGNMELEVGIFEIDEAVTSWIAHRWAFELAAKLNLRLRTLYVPIRDERTRLVFSPVSNQPCSSA
jgi:hypothetical protein